MTTQTLKTQFELFINNESGHELQFALNMVNGKPYLLIKKCLPKNNGKSWKEVEQLVKHGGEVRRESWPTNARVFYRDGGFSICTVGPDGVTVYDYTPASSKSDWIITKYPPTKLSYADAMEAVRAGRKVRREIWQDKTYVKMIDDVVYFYNVPGPDGKAVKVPYSDVLANVRLSRDWTVLD